MKAPTFQEQGMGESTVVAAFVTLMVRVAEGQGVPRREVLRRSGISEDMLADPDGRVPFEKLMVIWDVLAEDRGALLLGRHLLAVEDLADLLHWFASSGSAAASSAGNRPVEARAPRAPADPPA